MKPSGSETGWPPLGRDMNQKLRIWKPECWPQSGISLCVCVCVCVRACVRARVCVCVCVRARALFQSV
jgi:hypothetical protein